MEFQELVQRLHLKVVLCISRSPSAAVEGKRSEERELVRGKVIGVKGKDSRAVIGEAEPESVLQLQ